MGRELSIRPQWHGEYDPKSSRAFRIELCLIRHQELFNDIKNQIRLHGQMIEDNSEDDVVFLIKSKHLKHLVNHEGVLRHWHNIAAWAYLDCMPDEADVILEWG